MSLDIGQQKPMKLQAVHLKADNNRPDAINHNFADVRQRELAVLSERVDKLPDYAWVTIGDFNEAGISVPNMQELVPSNASVGTYLNNANRGSSRLDKAFGHNVILEHAEILTCDDEPSDHRPVLVTVRPQPKNWR
jgi:endonuclease/exonuclease/phosphatase family metal-dependent hydrolase